MEHENPTKIAINVCGMPLGVICITRMSYTEIILQLFRTES